MEQSTNELCNLLLTVDKTSEEREDDEGLSEDENQEEKDDEETGAWNFSKEIMLYVFSLRLTIWFIHLYYYTITLILISADVKYI